MLTAEDSKIQELKNFISECRKRDYPNSQLIAILHKAQELFGYISVEVMDVVAERMRIPTAHIWGVATFYHYFNLKPTGRHVISVCLGTACYVKGIQDITEAIKNELKINFGETTEDKIFTLQEARCLGACGLAPVVMIDDKIYGQLTPQKTLEIIKNIRKKANKDEAHK